MTIELTEMSVSFTLDKGAIRDITGGNDIARALEIIGQVGEAAAKQNAPVDTGHLRRSITHELDRRGFNQFVRIGTNVSYAVFQELGTRFHPAQPFLRPALGTIEEFVRRA